MSDYPGRRIRTAERGFIGDKLLRHLLTGPRALRYPKLLKRTVP